MTTEECFVFIAGGGPVGLSLAFDLGDRGVPVILANDNPETARHPKCHYVHTRTMEHFRRLGIADEITQNGIKQVSRAVAFRTRYCGFELGRIHLSFLALENWPGPEYPLNISQLAVEPVLRAHAEAQPSVSVRFGWRVTALSQGEDGALITIENVTDGEQRQIRARYVVGCDGSRSLVRRTLGISMAGKDGSAVHDFMSGTMLTYFFRSEMLHARCGHQPAVMTWIVNNDARGWIMSQNGRDQFVAHFRVPAEVDWRSLDSSEVLERLLGPGIEYSMISQGPWTGGLALVAERFEKDGVFLAGDAAHLYTPLGGFGLNTGIGDAMNVSWKLAAVYKGWGGAGLIASYHTERHPICERNSQIGVTCAARKDHWIVPPDINEDTPEAEARRRALGAFIEEDDKQEYATIGIQLGERYASPIIASDASRAPPPDPWDRYVPSDYPGARVPHFRLPDGRSLYDALGDGFGLIAFGTAESLPLEAAARDRGVPLTLIRIAERPDDYARDLILVRPDQHIAWSGDRLPASSAELIDQVRGAIS